MTAGTRPGDHAVYPGTFDPITPGHLDIIERARHLFARVTVLVAVNGDKHPTSTQSERVIRLRREVPADWGNISVAGWEGLTAKFCREHGAGVIIRGVRNRSDLRREYQLAAMNQGMGITTLLLPAQPGLVATSSTMLRGLGSRLTPQLLPEVLMTTIAAPDWFTAALEALRAGDVDGYMRMYTDDAVHEFPFAPEAAVQRLEGKSAIAEYMRSLPARVKFDSFDDVRVRAAGDELIVEATGHGRRPGSGAPFHMQYVWFITHKDGRVSRFRDYMNPRHRSA